MIGCLCDDFNQLVNDLLQNYLFCLRADTIHLRNPPQLVRSFQLFIDAFSFSHLGDHPFHSIPADLICFRQMLIQLAGENQTSV